MQRILQRSVILILALSILLVALASATSVTESPDVVQQGDQITLSIADLPDGATFSLDIGGKFAVTPGSSFQFQTQSFNMPFSLSKGTVSASTQGTKVTQFAVQKGDSSVVVRNPADSSGFFTISKAYDISSGLYDFLSLSGTARTDASEIDSHMNLVGTKTGPSTTTITFTVNGIANGEVYLTALVNGNQVLFKKVTVGNGISAATPPPTPTDTTATPTETVTTEATTPSGTETSAVVTSQPTESPTAVTTAPTSAVTQAGPSVFNSADREVTLTANGIDYAALLMVDSGAVPENWVMVTSAYRISPDSVVFATPATLSFAIPSTGADYAYFVGSYQNGQWVPLPSSAGSGSIGATIDRVGTYALMAYRPESTIPATTAPVAGQASAAATSVQPPSGTPKVASIAQAGAPASAAAAAAAPTAKSPLDALPVLAALAVSGAAAVVLLRKGD